MRYRKLQLANQYRNRKYSQATQRNQRKSQNVKEDQKRGSLDVKVPGNRSAKFVPYLVPGLVGLLVIVVIPFVWNIYLSFTRWRGVGPVKFVGLQNWKRLFADSTFWISFANSFWIIVAIVVIPTILGLFISSLLTDVIQKKFGGKTASFLRAMFYLPQLLPVAVAAIIMAGSSVRKMAR